MGASESLRGTDVPVLIIGGGMTGLSAAIMLRHHGVDCVLVDRGDGGAPTALSRGVHKRTMEIYRQLGLEGELTEAVLRTKGKGGLSVRIGASAAQSQPMQVAPRGYRGNELSPSQFLFLPEVEVEPVLLAAARARAADVRLNTEVVGLTQDTDGVTATLAGPDGVTTVRARYVIGTDGRDDVLRACFRATGWALPPSQHYIGVDFRADVAELYAEIPFSQIRLTGGAVEGLLAAVNTTGDFVLSIEYDPARETPDAYPAKRCADLVRAAFGAGDIDVDLQRREAWETGSFVADEYRNGRLFRAGDAAHRRPPWGGYTPNIGVADVHNLTWKLATVLAGRAGDALLDTYQHERRPRAIVAAEQAAVMNDFHARFGVETPENAASLARLIGMEPTMSRFCYGAPDVHFEDLTGQVGTRVPHLWLTADDPRVSTLDECDHGFTVLADTDLDSWRTAVAEAGAATGVAVTLVPVNAAVTDEQGRWRDETRMPGGGALLVRPDQYVVARTDEKLSPGTLVDAVRRVVA